MSITRPTSDQVTFVSSSNGTTVLDTYLEACEKGGRSLPDLLDDLWTASGVLDVPVAFRENPSVAGSLQYRVGTFVDANAGWATFTSTDFTSFVTACTNAKTAAETAETNAETAETNAETAATSAANNLALTITARNAAQSSEDDAQISEDNAAQHEADAVTAKNDAVTAKTASENAKTASETAKDASVAAKDASVVAQGASVVAQNASVAAQGASENARDAAEGYKNTATTQASTATTQASTATNKAVIATDKATEAANSASGASSSATDASGFANQANAARLLAEAAFDNFDDRYLGAKGSEPSVDNDGNALASGALYFLTGTGMQVYDGSDWVAASAVNTVSFLTYEYIATAGQTSFSGADVNGQTLTYSANNIHVTYGGLDIPVADYVATNGTAVVLDDGAVVGTIVRIVAFKSFTVADTYTKAQTDAKVVQGGVFYENPTTIAANYTITTNKNAMTAGPITVNSGVTVTVPTNSTWTIV